MSPLCTPHHKQCDCTGSCRSPHFFVLGVLVLGFHEDLFYCGVAFEVSLYTILTTYVLKLCAKPCVYSITTYPMVDLGLEMVVFSMIAFRLLLNCELLLLSPGCGCWSLLLVGLLPLSWRLLLLESSQLLFKNLLCTLLMVQWGYLHLTKAFLRCCSSLWRSSGPVQTVLALWVSVPMTLYLADRLWWLSHCKPWSVCMGLWYTVIERELSVCSVIKVSRKGMATFPCLPSTVNLIAGSILLIWSRNAC